MGWQDDPVVEAIPTTTPQSSRQTVPTWQNDPVVETPAMAQAASDEPSPMETWIRGNPDHVKRLAGIEQPSRSDFEKAGLPRMPASDRAELAKVFREYEAEYKKPGVAERAAVGLGSGTIQGAQAGGGLVEAFGDFFEKAREVVGGTARWNPAARMMGFDRIRQYGRKNVVQEVGSTAEQFYGGILDEVGKVYPQGDVTRNPKLLADPGWWVQGIGQAASSMSTGVIAGGGTAAGGAVAGALMEAMPTYIELKEKVGAGEAAARATVFGLAVAALNKIGLDKIMAKGDPLTFKKVLVAALTEGGTEAMEEPAQTIAELAGREGVTLTEFGKEMVESMRRGANTFLSAFVTGGLFKAAGAAVERRELVEKANSASAIPPEQMAEGAARLANPENQALEERKRKAIEAVKPPAPAPAEPTQLPATPAQEPQGEAQNAPASAPVSRTVRDRFPSYPEDLVSDLTKLPDEIREDVLDKLSAIDKRMEQSGGPAEGALYWKKLSELRAKATAGATVLRSAQEKVDKGHKNAKPERVEYGKQLLDEFLAEDVNSEKYQPINTETDAEGVSGVSKHGDPFTAGQESGDTASALIWSKKSELNGKTIRESKPIHWHAKVRTRYGHFVDGFGQTRQEAIDEAKAQVADSEKSAWEYTRKKWSKDELEGLREGTRLGTIAFARGFKGDTTRKDHLIESILKDQELKQSLGKPYDDVPPGTERATGDTKTSPTGEEAAPQEASPAAEAAGQGEAVASDEEDKASTTVFGAPDGKQIPFRQEETPVAELKLSKDVPQFKEDADPTTGVVDPLEGKYERLGSPPIVVWERANGDKEVITGRHRLDLARRSGEKTIPAQIVKESDGFTKEMAAIFDAEANIRDGQGKVSDYANYFRQQAGITREEASRRGLLSRKQGRSGFTLGQDASDDLYALYRAKRISEAKAVAIAEAAPGNQGLQALGIQYAASHDADETAQYLKAAQSLARPSGQGPEQIDMFGADESWKQEAEKIGQAATKRVRAITEEMRALKSARSLSGPKRREILERYGVSVGDTEAMEGRIQQLTAESVRWDHWQTDIDLQRQLRIDAGLPVAQPSSLTLESPTAAQLEAEAKAKTAKEEANAAKDEAAAPLTAGPLDTTGDLFDQSQADNPLFAAPSPKPVKGVGAAAAGSSDEFVPKGKVEATDATSLKRSVAEIERRAMGFPPEVRDAARRFPEVVDKAWDRLVKNPEAGDELVKELQATPRPLSDVDVALLLITKVYRFNARNAAASETVKLAESGTEEQKRLAQQRYEVAAAKLEEIFDVAARGAGKAVTETARGLNAIRMMLDDQFNLVEMEQAVRDKQGGAPVSEQQRAQIAAIKASYDTAKAKLDAEVARLEADVKAKDEEIAQAKASIDFEKLVREVMPKEERKPRVFKKAALDLADKWEAEYDAYMKESAGRASAGVDPMRLVVMSKLGAAYIIRGTVAVADWTTAMRTKFKDATDAELSSVYEKAKVLAEAAGQRDDAEEKKQRGSGDGKKRPATKEEPSKEELSIKELFRAQVVEGVRDLDTAVKNVHEIVEAERPGITPEEVRDEFSGYGKSWSLSPDEVSEVLSDLRRQAQLVASIEHVEQKRAPLKSGPQRGKPSQRVRELTKELNAKMKAAGIRTVDPATQLASSLAAIKTRLQNSIADIEKAIATRERMVANKSVVPYDNEANILKARRDELRAQYDEMFPPTPLTDEQRLNIAIKAAERSLDAWNQRVKDARSGKFIREGKSSSPWSAKLSDLKRQQQEAKDEVQRLKEIANPPKSPEQVAIEAKRKRLERAITDMERRMKEKDFAPRKREPVDISGDADAVKAQAEFEQVKKDFAAMKEEARRANRTWPEVMLETGIDVAHSTKNVLASADVSAPGRQGWFLGAAHPILWFKNYVPMLRTVSREQSLKVQAKFRERANYKNGLYARAKLALSPDDGTGNFTQVEDAHRLDLASKIPFLGRMVEASNRTYATYLNTLRADVFDLHMANSDDPSDVSDEKIQAIAAGVNELSGRGDVGRHAESLAVPFWAPRFIKSAFDVATFKPVHGKGIGGLGSVKTTRETKAMFAKEYLKVAGSIVAIYALASLFRGKDDDPIELDLRSNKFGAIRFGKQVFNPLSYARSVLTLLAKLITGQEKRANGEIVNLRESYLPFASDKQRAQKTPYGSGMADPFLSFMEGKRHPMLSTVWSLPIVSGKKFGGRKQTWFGAAADLATPLTPRQIYDLYQTDDADAATVSALLTVLGFDVKPDHQNPVVMAYEADSPAEFRKRVGNVLYTATGEKASEGEKALARKLLAGMPEDDSVAILRESVQAKRTASHAKTPLRIRESSGKLSSYGERLARLRAIRE